MITGQDGCLVLLTFVMDITEEHNCFSSSEFLVLHLLDKCYLALLKQWVMLIVAPSTLLSVKLV